MRCGLCKQPARCGAAGHDDPPTLRPCEPLARACRRCCSRRWRFLPKAHRLALEQNLGKALGGYITGWQAPTVNLLVLDELKLPAGASSSWAARTTRRFRCLYGLQR